MFCLNVRLKLNCIAYNLPLKTNIRHKKKRKQHQIRHLYVAHELIHLYVTYLLSLSYTGTDIFSKIYCRQNRQQTPTTTRIISY